MMTRRAVQLLILLNIVGFVSPRGGLFASELLRFARESRHMGTVFEVILYAPDPQLAEAAFAAVFDRLTQLDSTLSNYQSESELSRLNHGAPHASPVRISDDFWRVLREADQISRSSGGAFDVTIGPASKLWRRARRIEELPSPERLREVMSAVGYEGIEYSPQCQAVRLTRPGMAIDLGGIAKGDALDQCLALLKERGLSRALINGGGDIVVGDPPPGETAWKVGIASIKRGEPIAEWLGLANAAVATSGDLWQFVEIEGIRYSHLIDPRTGMGMTRRGSVTVVADSASQADGWASALSVLGPEQGLEIVAAQDGLQVRLAWVEDGMVRVQRTPHFPPTLPQP